MPAHPMFPVDVVRAQEMSKSSVGEPTLSQSVLAAKKYAKQQTKFEQVAKQSQERLNAVRSQVAKVTGYQLVADVRKVHALEGIHY